MNEEKIITDEKKSDEKTMNEEMSGNQETSETPIEEVSDITDIYARLAIIEVLLTKLYQEKVSEMDDPVAVLEEDRTDFIEAIENVAGLLDNDPSYENVGSMKKAMIDFADKFFVNVGKAKSSNVSKAENSLQTESSL